MRRKRDEELLRYASIRYVAPVRIDGSQVRVRRERSGFGLRSFAALASISPAHLSRIERGERNPQPEVAARIAQALGASIADIEDRREEISGSAVHDNERGRHAHPEAARGSTDDASPRNRA